MFAALFLKMLVILLVTTLGYVAGRLRWLGPGDAARVLSNAAFYIFVPALLFRTTAKLDFAVMPWGTVAAFFVPVVVFMLGVYVWQRRALTRTGLPAAAPSTRAITACFGNSVQLGIPMAAAMFGDAGLPIHIAIVSLHSLTLLSVLTALVEVDQARDRVKRGLAQANLPRMLLDTARNTLIHPVVMPILLGLLWNVLSLPLPTLLDDTLSMLAQAVVPLCLVLIGVSLAQYGVRGSARGAVVLSALKLIVLPAVVLVVGRFGFGLSGLPLSVVVMAAALPVGNNALIFAQRYNTLEGEATTAIVLSTFAFAVTAPLWLVTLQLLA